MADRIETPRQPLGPFRINDAGVTRFLREDKLYGMDALVHVIDRNDRLMENPR